LTIAIEEEYHIVDAVGDLKAHTKILSPENGEALEDTVRSEMIQSLVQAGTSFCETVEQARESVAGSRECRRPVNSVASHRRLPCSDCMRRA
jgi:glutamate---cysteine ligase / carboxylate-amine ligase